jgi:response regulator of citrate/malate metabolism
MSKIRTLLIEGNQIILDGLTATLEEEANIQVVGRARDAREAIASMDSRTDGCDVVVIDVFLRSGSGLRVRFLKCATCAGAEKSTKRTLWRAAAAEKTFDTARERGAITQA